MQVCEFDFGARYVDIPPAAGFDQDPMYLEASLIADSEAPRSLARERLGLHSPDLGPVRSESYEGPKRFLGDSFDTSMSGFGPEASIRDLDDLAQFPPPRNMAFDVMEIEFQGCFGGPSSDDDGAEAADATVGTAALDTSALIQEELEARVCLPLLSPITRGGPRLRRSKTPVSVHSIH